MTPEAPPAWQPSTSSPSCLRFWTPWSSRRICRGSVLTANKVGDWWMDFHPECFHPLFKKAIFHTTAMWPSGVAASHFYKSLSQSSITVAISAAPDLFLSPKGTPARSHGFWRKRPPHSRWWAFVSASIAFCVVVFLTAQDTAPFEGWGSTRGLFEVLTVCGTGPSGALRG